MWDDGETPMTLRTWLGLALFFVVGLVLTIGAAQFAEPERSIIPHHPLTVSPTTRPCQEDEPCWDCHTMGNRQCEAPTTTTTAPLPDVTVYPGYYCPMSRMPNVGCIS